MLRYCRKSHKDTYGTLQSNKPTVTETGNTGSADFKAEVKLVGRNDHKASGHSTGDNAFIILFSTF